MSSCASMNVIVEKHRIPETGCVVFPRGGFAHGNANQWDMNIMIRCSLGSGVESH